MRTACNPAVLGLAAVFGAGCSLQYHYPPPSASDLRELEALTVAGLEVDTGRIPTDLPAGPIVASLEARHGRYFVPVRLNGRRAELMLDWGSWVTVGLLPYMVRTAGVKLSDQVMATHTFDGEGDMRTGLIDEVSIAGAMFRDVPFAMSDRDIEVTLAGVTVYRGHGMLGLTLPAGYGRFAIDMAGELLYLGTVPSALLASREVVTLPVRVDKALWIDATVDGMPLQLKVDIGGYRGSVLLDGSAAAAFMRSHPSQFSGYSTGFGDSVRRRRRGRAGVVRAGDYELRDVPVSLLPPGDGGAASEHDGAVRGGVVGQGFFGKTMVGVDWERGELYFVPTLEPR